MQRGFPLTCDLAPGDFVPIGNAVTLGVPAIECDWIGFQVESPEGECPGTGMDGEDADRKRKQGWWELN